MNSVSVIGFVGVTLLSSAVFAAQPQERLASDEVISQQRAQLALNTDGKGYGPQSPRDIDAISGRNKRDFGDAPAYTEMNLCNIHFHKNAEHKGGEFTLYAGNGDGKGHQTGYQYSGTLSDAEKKPVAQGKPGGVNSGDTIEVHYVHTTAQVKPGATLSSCLSEAIKNPQLRVETQVYVLVNDDSALDFNQLTSYAEKEGFYQVENLPNNTGTPIIYDGSTTGPSYNEIASPLQVTWSVRPKVAKVDVNSVLEWFKGNDFKEDHAHAVRNLVTNLDLLSEIEK